MPRPKNRNVAIGHKSCFIERNEKIKDLIYNKSETLKNVEMELQNDIIKCNKRRVMRDFIYRETSEYPECNTSVASGGSNPYSSRASIPEFVKIRYEKGQTSYFTEKIATDFDNREHPHNVNVHFRNKSSKKESLQFLPRRIHEKRPSLLTNSIRMAHFKDETSEGQTLYNKIKKSDFQAILNHLALCYTYQLIEVSNLVPDRDWSGSDLPFVDEIADFIFVGGYGNIDGVTECNNINLAAKKYQNIDFNNDEAVEALSHMYSMGHLLDGVQNTSRKDSKRTPLHIVSDDDEEDVSEKSNSELKSE